MSLSTRVVIDEAAMRSADVMFADLFQDKRGQEIKEEEDTTSSSVYISTLL